MINIKDEFIGKKIKITKSTMKHQQGVEGIIVNETKNTFTILSDGKEKKILKNKKEFMIEETKINGKKIQKRPEERIKIKEK
ncbi:ribonuclease P protein subunit [Candidatus Woesearchaeota archaeon]|nr:ribonuclease P protein subunit [Candidatus Woesearchaeota archaeon]